MCTLALLPLPTGALLVAMNRDELRSRPAALGPAVHRWQRTAAIAPVDAHAGGTWIAVTEHGLVLTLLNRYDTPRALQRALHPLPGAPSRGHLIPSLADLRTPDEVARRCASDAGLLRDLAPFDLVVARGTRTPNGVDAVQVRWDGAHFERYRLEGPFLLASPALDQVRTQAARRAVFPALVTACAEAEDDAAAQHTVRAWFSQHLGGAPGPKGVCMHRAEASTVSHAQALVAGSGARLSYFPGAPCRGGVGEVVELGLAGACAARGHR